MSERATRAERVAEITALRARGLSYREVAAELGVTASAVRSIMNDPDGSKQRARRVRYQGVCVECGGPTDGASGREKAPLRCRFCARGVERPLSEPSRRRRLPVRLSDIPSDVRIEGARDANRYEQGLEERSEILFAAIFPSSTVYYVSESARPLLASFGLEPKSTSSTPIPTSTSESSIAA